ncbi:hypothetical protein [Pseudodesulfovibrio pelocollis]|uniref:hypothetical protein n=1 Tax=Pseudodesulfovibrio pelocollis TaxID=3051432 RepID=UPI00255AAC70|nr:hypothetical protein [Pseudodesulfovibrio sp. SB368]
MGLINDLILPQKADPFVVDYSALITEALANSPDITTNATISVWVKPCGVFGSVLAAQDCHYHIVIQKESTSVAYIIDGGSPVMYSGTIGTTFHSLLGNVLAEIAGSASAYFSQLHCISGQIVNADRFGVATEDKWVPKRYSGPWGTNGSALLFEDAADMGKDSSGGDNHWALSGVQTLDTPTENYMVFKRNFFLLGTTSTASGYTLTEGNRRITLGVSPYGFLGTWWTLPDSGKWYWEFYHHTRYTTSGVMISGNRFVCSVYTTNIQANPSQSGLTEFREGNTLGVAYNADTETIQLYRNGSAHGSPVNVSWTSAALYPAMGDWVEDTATSVRANFGSTGFAYTPPTGYLPLTAQNIEKEF